MEEGSSIGIAEVLSFERRFATLRRKPLDTARVLMTLFEADRGALLKLGRSSASAFLVHDVMQLRPLVTIQVASRELQLSPSDRHQSLEHPVDLGTVREMTDKRRRRVF